jgi:hypothetical protein
VTRISSENWSCRGIQRTYIYRIAHDGLAVLNNKSKVRVIHGKRQALRANAAPNIDN